MLNSHHVLSGSVSSDSTFIPEQKRWYHLLLWGWEEANRCLNLGVPPQHHNRPRSESPRDRSSLGGHRNAAAPRAYEHGQATCSNARRTSGTSYTRRSTTTNQHTPDGRGSPDAPEGAVSSALERPSESTTPREFVS